MLKTLHIENYALIKNLDLIFDKGFSVITGETGAGKSIMLGALGLLLGQRSDIKAIKEGELKCILEANFDIEHYHLQELFDENDIDYDPNCIIRREILTSGKSRMFVNDTPVNIQFLKQLGEKLLDIHSQYENLLIKDNLFQLNVIDAIAENKNILEDYIKTFTAYKKAERQYEDLLSFSEKEKANYDYLSFQFEQLSSAGLSSNEQEELEREQTILSHAEEIKTILYKSQLLLDNEEIGILSVIKNAINNLQSITHVYTKAENLYERLNSCFIDLKDIAEELNKQENNIESQPERLEFINNRLDTIYSLCQKHKVTNLEDLIALQNSLKEQLDKLDSFDSELERLSKLKEELLKEVLTIGENLSKKRKSAAKKIEKTMIEQLSVLGMPNVQFVIEITKKNVPDITGCDYISFLFSANKNVSPKAVSQIASGGEISRVMLCLKSLIATASNLPTIIFDEIDTGVSGEIADKMGNIMKEMGGKIQVICITHLPQIAAKGTKHYRVYKIEEETSETKVVLLNAKERVQEIAKMLSGSNLTEAALKNAEELLKQ